MSKSNNLVLKFREFWNSLSGREKGHLWDIMTALRGADSGDDRDFVKTFTTARIRGELLGQDFYKGFIHITFEKAKRFHGRYNWRAVTESFIKHPSHFYCHVTEAIEVLKLYRPKSAMRDLEKFLTAWKKKR